MPHKEYFHGGASTARIRTGDEDARIQQERRACARGNLAAMLVDEAGGLEVAAADPQLRQRVAADFRKLCDALGLDPPAPREPGVCVRPSCGHPLSMTACSGKGSAKQAAYHREGFCSQRCKRLSNLSNVEAVE